MKFNQALNNFSAGEWSPKMKGRTDVKEYMNACETLENFLPQIQGGAFRRPPTKKITLSADYNTDLQAATSFKMIPRSLSDGTRELLVAMNTAPSTTWFAINGTTDAQRVITTVQNYASTYSTADFTSGGNYDYVQVGDLVVLCERTTAIGSPPRVWSGASASDTLNLYSHQSTYFYAHSHPGDYKSVPYLPPESNGSGVTLSVTAGTPTVRGNTITVGASAAFFDPGHKGAYFKFSDGTQTGVCIVTARASSTSVTMFVMEVFGASTAFGGTAAPATSWEESAWSDYRGWPRTVTAYQGRLIFGGSASYPCTIWGTRIGNVLDLMEIPLDQDPASAGYTTDNSRPFTLTPNTGTNGYITGVSAAKTLLVHTNQGEIVGYGTNGALGPNDVAFESSTSFGSSNIMPTRTNNYAVFVDKTGRKLRDIIFDFNESQYKSSDLTFLADHLTIDKVAQADRFDPPPSSPESIDSILEIQGFSQGSSYVVARTTSGKLLALALDREYQMNAWATLTIAGKNFDSDSNTRSFAKVIALGALQSTHGDQLYLITNRKMGGTISLFVEKMIIPTEFSEIVDGGSTDSMQCDLKTTATVTAASTITGVTAFANETVELFLGTRYVGQKVVSAGGVIDLGETFTGIAVYGLPYTSTLKTMPIEIGQQVPGSPLALFKRVNEVNIKFYNTRGAKIGYKESDMFNIGFNAPDEVVTDNIKLYSGTKRLMFASNYDQEAQIIVKQDKPWPCNITAIVAKGQLYD